MKLPWTKRRPRYEPPPPPTEEERAEAERRMEEIRRQQQLRALRALSIPADLAGFRLVRGCTCGAREEWEAKLGSPAPYSREIPRASYSGGLFHKDGCEEMDGLHVQVIEDGGVPPLDSFDREGAPVLA